MEPQLLLPPMPRQLPTQSLVGAATKAMSMWTSPPSMARGRPPWLRMMAGVFSLPADTTSPIRPRIPLVWMPMTLPCSMYSAMGSWALPRLVAAMVRSFRPSSSMAAFMTMLTTKSPSRR